MKTVDISSQSIKRLYWWFADRLQLNNVRQQATAQRPQDLLEEHDTASFYTQLRGNIPIKVQACIIWNTMTAVTSHDFVVTVTGGKKIRKIKQLFFKVTTTSIIIDVCVIANIFLSADCRNCHNCRNCCECCVIRKNVFWTFRFQFRFRFLSKTSSYSYCMRVVCNMMAFCNQWCIVLKLLSLLSAATLVASICVTFAIEQQIHAKKIK